MNDEVATCYDNCVRPEIPWVAIIMLLALSFCMKVIFPITMWIDIKRERKRERDNWK